jgi:putative aldouronate transport system permease protein
VVELTHKNSKIKPMRIRDSLPDRVFMVISYALLTFILLLIVYPLIYVISSSFSAPSAVMTGKVWLYPVDLSLEGYKAVFKNNQVFSGYYNTIIYTFVATAYGVVLTIMLAFPLSRKDFYGKKAIMAYIVFTMLFSGGMVPTYLTIKDLSLLGTRWSIILPLAISAYNVIIARTFFATTIPDELREAADLDGCSDIGFIWHVVLPLSKAIISVLILFYAVYHWNSYMPALLYLRKSELFPLQIVLRNILIMNKYSAEMVADVQSEIAAQGLEALLKYSLIVVSSLPILALYPFIQKYFVQGVMIGSIKG